MESNTFISEKDATFYAGVSKNTLDRFREAGYLRTQSDLDGTPRYSRTELQDLFGLPAIRDTFDKDRALSSSVEISSDSSPTHNISAQDGSAFDRSGIHSGDMKDSSAFNQTNQNQIVEGAKYHAEVLEGSSQSGSTHEKSIEINKGTKEKRDDDTSDSKLEIARLKNLINLQERILDIKDNELKQCRQEIEWLRSRIEKYEDKTDRDQILLLAETQMIRKLVSMQSQKKQSLMRQTLEFFGLATPPRQDLPVTLRDTVSQDTLSR